MRTNHPRTGTTSRFPLRHGSMPNWERLSIGTKPTSIVSLATDRVKIGSSANIAQRVADLATAMPYPPLLIAYELGRDARSLERSAHSRWKPWRRNREWFAVE